MTEDPFKTATTGYGPKEEELLGKLLIITPNRYREGINTKFGPKDSVDGRVVIVNEEDPAKSEETAFSTMGGRLIGGLKDYVGKNALVLGRMGQEPTDKGNPAWVLIDPTPKDKATAMKYLDSRDPFDAPGE